MSDHFNNAIQILNNNPLELGLVEIGDYFNELSKSPNQDMLLDLFTRTRSIEDRTLFCTYLLDMRDQMGKRIPDDEDFIQFIEKIFVNMGKKEIIFKLLNVSYAQNYREMIISGLNGKLMEIVNSAEPDEIQHRLINLVGRNTEYFTIRSLHVITTELLSSLLETNEEKSMMLEQIRLLILMGRRLIPEDDFLKETLSILTEIKKIDANLAKKVANNFILSDRKIDIAEIITQTRPLPDRLSIFAELSDAVGEAKRNSRDSVNIEVCATLLIKDDPMLRDVLNNLMANKNK